MHAVHQQAPTVALTVTGRDKKKRTVEAPCRYGSAGHRLVVAIVGSGQLGSVGPEAIILDEPLVDIARIEVK